MLLGGTETNQIDLNDNYAALEMNNKQNSNIEKLDMSDNKNKKRKNPDDYHELQEDV